MIGVVPQRPINAAAVPLAKVFFGIRFAGDEPTVTSGSLLDLPVGDPGTATWWSGIQTSPFPRSAPADYSVSETYPASVREAFAEVTTDSVQVDYEMARLEAAAQAGDESAFLVAQNTIDWSRRSAEDFMRAVQLALAAGAYSAARRLSDQGITLHPNHPELRKVAHVLAPPKVTRSTAPPDPTMKVNRDWLMANGDRYRGRWVALHNGDLIGVSDSLKSLAHQIGDTKGVLLTKVF